MKKIIFLACVVLVLWTWFKTYNGPFKPVVGSHDIVEVQYHRLQPVLNTNLYCSGFSGECDFPKEGLKLQVSFHGVRWNKPHYIFMNIWGGGTGLKWYETYYGRRHLRLVDKQGRILAHYAQIIWNSSAYGDLGRLIVFDPTRRIVFVAHGAYGFNAMYDQGYAHAFADLI